ncbi:metallo-beta-lactamase family protein [Luminiphilus syltensis NOR5-1B]|uniref:Metallo-beta-lactamase family protein n=1 Tax=Luminiphilus syltensis NOR5-1B TaxID=565045 RepID=B8KSC0_9GAMM|nr:MBL fold metallo-hydrolase [Luminiphilus syltensis]EED34361.1 metallo-beta-lactamase family protein [Luminiphilus syltensis NOR5-1B]
MNDHRTPHNAVVKHFFDPRTWTLTYIVTDPETRHCAIVDPVLDLDYASGTLTTESADEVIAYVTAEGLTVDYILETHVHADHLTSAPYLKEKLGGKIAIGSAITTVQSTFAQVYNETDAFPTDGSQFDVTLSDNDSFKVGNLVACALHVPGHTPACMAYRIDDALFVGDTLFMPDAGTARCDFPGGDAKTLYRSIKKLLNLPAETRVFVCHDYQPNGRQLAYETTIGDQRKSNIHVKEGVTEEEFVTMRETRDNTLAMPTLILPSLQVNMRAGHLPPAEANGRLFLSLPINVFGGDDVARFADKI